MAKIKAKTPGYGDIYRAAEQRAPGTPGLAR
jgi:hypothetical protein